jgi:hypothetical protein
MAEEPQSRTHTTGPFAPVEWDLLRKEDRKAAAGVAGIMITIFLLAVVGYSIVAVLAALAPP